jgi:conjugative transposon TraN protein
MKKIIVAFCLQSIMLCQMLHAQRVENDIPLSTAITPYKLKVGYNYNTIIAFPGVIKKAYWGYNEIDAQTVPGVDNIIMIKALKRDFDSTNLHVFTSDEKIYSFNVTYTQNPLQTTYDLKRLSGNTIDLDSSTIVFSDMPLNDLRLAKYIQEVKDAKPFFGRISNHFGIKLRIQGIYTLKNLMLFRFQIRNGSNIDYDLDFTKLYIKDKKVVKRSSIQQREIIPILKDSIQTIPGQSKGVIVMAVPKFTIPDSKNFWIEIYEKGGGRIITMKIKNRHLLKARQLK